MKLYVQEKFKRVSKKNVSPRNAQRLQCFPLWKMRWDSPHLKSKEKVIKILQKKWVNFQRNLKYFLPATSIFTKIDNLWPWKPDGWKTFCPQPQLRFWKSPPMDELSLPTDPSLMKNPGAPPSPFHFSLHKKPVCPK